MSADVQVCHLIDRIDRTGNPALIDQVTKAVRQLPEERKGAFATRALELLGNGTPDLTSQIENVIRSETEPLASKALERILEIARIKARLLACGSAAEMFGILNEEGVRERIIFTNETYGLLVKRMYAEALELFQWSEWSDGDPLKDLQKLYIRVTRNWKPPTIINLSDENILFLKNTSRLLGI